MLKSYSDAFSGEVGIDHLMHRSSTQQAPVLGLFFPIPTRALAAQVCQQLVNAGLIYDRNGNGSRYHESPAIYFSISDKGHALLEDCRREVPRFSKETVFGLDSATLIFDRTEQVVFVGEPAADMTFNLTRAFCAALMEHIIPLPSPAFLTPSNALISSHLSAKNNSSTSISSTCKKSDSSLHVRPHLASFSPLLPIRDLSHKKKTIVGTFNGRQCIDCLMLATTSISREHAAGVALSLLSHRLFRSLGATSDEEHSEFHDDHTFIYQLQSPSQHDISKLCASNQSIAMLSDEKSIQVSRSAGLNHMDDRLNGDLNDARDRSVASLSKLAENGGVRDGTRSSFVSGSGGSANRLSPAKTLPAFASLVKIARDSGVGSKVPELPENMSSVNTLPHREIYAHENLTRPAPSLKMLNLSDSMPLNIRLHEILKDARAIRAFVDFMNDNLCLENLLFWLDVESFKNSVNKASPGNASQFQIVPKPLLNAHRTVPVICITPEMQPVFSADASIEVNVASIYNAYLSTNSPSEINIDSRIRKSIRDRVEPHLSSNLNAVLPSPSAKIAPGFTSDMFNEIQSNIFDMMVVDSLPKFMKTPGYQLIYERSKESENFVPSMPEATVKPNPFGGFGYAANAPKLTISSAFGASSISSTRTM